ncbi:MAG: cation-translocating P-type ATPase [archaeon]
MHYNKSADKVFKEFRTAIGGLSEEEAGQRLLKYGPNDIRKTRGATPFLLLIAQFRSPLVMILIAATVFSALLGEKIDAAIIAVILVMNAVFGFVQEYRAEKSIEALKRLVSPKATVTRSGRTLEIDASGLVPGDILQLAEGDRIAADCRLISVTALQVQESSLTGESSTVSKTVDVLDGSLPVADRKNMVFSGTCVTAGHAVAVVVRTGMQTEIGKIAGMVQQEHAEITPLQLQIQHLAKYLGFATIGVCVTVFAVSLIRNRDLLELGFVPLSPRIIELILTAVSLAVAAIPEGLPAVVTISLALGVQRMARKNALVRRLGSVETLGSTTVICTDKTGTLTCNQMTVTKLYSGSRVFELSGSGYETSGRFLHQGKEVSPKSLQLLLKAAALCNNASIDAGVIGDPTEAALLVAAAKAGIAKKTLGGQRIEELPFTSQRKRMSAVYVSGTRTTAYVKGATDIILERCNKIYENGTVRAIRDSDRKRIMNANDRFAGAALRVLAFAVKAVVRHYNETGLTFVGLAAMIDPPREGVGSAIADCHRAGIKVVMITGDHAITASAIARKLGISGRVVTGPELDMIGNLPEVVDDIAVFARVNPEHKLRIVKALTKNGHVVAMTGDGVNDAPALKKAHIGIAMGRNGTDVAKEASDMILLDDNFASIRNAVEEGRGIFDNIRKFVHFLLSCNLGEVLVVFLGSLIFARLPLMAIHILWINLITDGLPALALGVDPIDPAIMRRKPRKTTEGIISGAVAVHIIVVGLLISAAALFLFKIGLSVSLVKAQTLTLTAIVFLELVVVQMIRRQHNESIFSNRYLLGALALSIMLHVGILYSPLNKLFGVVALGFADWLIIIGVTLVLLAVCKYMAGILSRLARVVRI